MYDAVQMAGRIRSGITNLYIITDAKQLINYNDYTEISFSKKVLVENTDVNESQDCINTYLVNEYLIKENELQKSYTERRTNLMKFVKLIEDRFSYIRYSLFSQKFEYFHTKEKSEKMSIAQEEAFTKMLLSGNNAYVENWFPKSNVSRELSAQAFCNQYLKNLLKPDGYKILNKTEFKKHLSIIRDRFGSDLKQAKSILKLVDDNYNFTERTNDYVLYYGEKDPRLQKQKRFRQMKKRPKR